MRYGNGLFQTVEVTCRQKIEKKDLARLANLSTSTVSKLSSNQNVNTNVLVKICEALECNLCDIADVNNTMEV